MLGEFVEADFNSYLLVCPGIIWDGDPSKKGKEFVDALNELMINERFWSNMRSHTYKSNKGSIKAFPIC